MSPAAPGPLPSWLGELFDVVPGPVAVSSYRVAAHVSGRLLAAHPAVESLLIHRSVATGEVHFGRSDIDLLLVLTPEAAEGGEVLARLFHHVQRVRALNPVVSHVEMYEPGGVGVTASHDTFWGSLERRSARHVAGKRVPFPDLPCSRDDAVRRFLLWIELFFSSCLARKDTRNLWKISLECWAAYAVAQGLLAEPPLRRVEMERELLRVEPGVDPARLREPSYATSFVMGLGARLHEGRLPPLRRLPAPVVFDVVTAPIILPRRMVVLPAPDHSLPPEVYAPGAFPCTPEVLDLMLHLKNPFLSWALPPPLWELGIAPPRAEAWLPALWHYGQPRFLLYPGFTDPRPPVQALRLRCLEHTADALERGEPPSPLSQEVLTPPGGALDLHHYYGVEYAPLRRRSLALRARHARLLTRGGG